MLTDEQVQEMQFGQHTREQLHELIDTYLDERRDSNGGWAKITHKDMADLHAIIQSIIDLKCEPDPDGDRPIEYALVDRQTHRFEIDPWLLTMPYENNDANPIASGGKLEKLAYLTTILTDKLHNEMTRVRWVQEGKI